MGTAQAKIRAEPLPVKHFGFRIKPLSFFPDTRKFRRDD
jgi:hypothetical protein